MTRLRALVAGLAVALLASPAAAQDPQQLQHTGTGSITWDWPGAGAGRVGPYQARILSEPGQPTIDVYCVDFQHTISSGQVWNATFSNVMGDLSNTRAGAVFGETTARTMYQQAAWLTTQYDGSRERTIAIQSAIWNIFNGSSPDYGYASGLWQWKASQYYASSGLDYSQFSVVTDVGFRNGGTQEFLTPYTPLTVTPEPGTYLLMASGLAGLGIFARRRRRQSQGCAGRHRRRR